MTDYFAPAFRVELNGSRLEADITANIEEVSIVSKPNGMDTFTLTLVNPYPELRWTHSDDAELFKEGTGVKIYLGYVDEVLSVFDGEITKISPVFPQSGAPTVTVEGHTRMHWLTGDRKTRTFQNMTDKRIVEQIAQEAGLEAKAEDPGTNYPHVTQSNQTDFEFLKGRADRINYEVLLQEARTLVFRPAREAEQPAATLVWGHPHLAMASSDYPPLRSFSPTLSTLQQVNSVEVRGYDPATKREIVGRANSGDQTNTMGGSKRGSEVSQSAFRRSRCEVVVNEPVTNQEEADQRARALLNQKAMAFVGGTALAVGIPHLRSGVVVQLEGLGRRFNGRYYVDEATHALGSSGYSTQLSLKRNSA
jgi:Bacteriophage probable baseplate hub protein